MSAPVRKSVAAVFAPPRFFVFRTPLLPFAAVEAWSAGLAAPAAAGDAAALPAALAADRELLRRRLGELLARPEVAEAVFVASPSLTDALEIWRRDPESKKGQRAERAVVRYFLRMASRPTPFGLFSGCSTAVRALPDSPPGTPDRTALALQPLAAYGRHTRLDMDYLFALCEELERNPEMRRELRFRPNSSLYRAAGRLRYAEARMENRVRSHHLVAVEASDYLEATLSRAKGGALAADLAAALVTAPAAAAEAAPGDEEAIEISAEDAAAFLTELIDSQVLVSDLSPPVTGPEAIHDLVEHLARLEAGREAAARLAAARDALAGLDARGPGAPPESYRAIAADLEKLPTPVEMARLFQVDMVKPTAEACLGEAVLAEVARAVDIGLRLGGRVAQESLDKFRAEFQERYGDRHVPLVEVLDEEIGIGFERASELGAEASPLLHGLALAPPANETSTPWSARHSVLLEKLQQTQAAGRQVMELTDEDLDRLALPGTDSAIDRFPGAFQAVAVIAAAGPEAVAAGDFQILVTGASGPSGARLLGRFCHADALLQRETEAHLRAEEALAPDALFAEIVHLPQGRIGNILSRPVMRDYEIPYLGRSGAPEERQIAITDVLVGVRGNRIELRSRRLDREIVPRLTSAHNFVNRSLGLYRFLCTLQNQDLIGGVGWSWGALESAQFLPRVTHGRLVLRRAAWWMTEQEIKRLAKARGAERYAAVQEWRAGRRLSRLVVLADGDNELLVDLDNTLSIDAFLDVVEERDRARLHELFPGPDELLAHGPEGRFMHELVIPYHRLPRPAAAADPASGGAGDGAARRGRAAAAAAASAALPRTFPPGSEWLYAKLYTGTATADRVLRDVVSPLVRDSLAGGLADGWFFIRYGDPEWHVRLRLHGDPAALSARVLPALHAAAAPLLADGRLWKMQLDTYERETERYGGPHAMALCEQLFQADSEAVMAILDMLEGDEGADIRWRLAFLGVDLLLDDLALGAEGKLTALSQMREGFAREFTGATPDEKTVKGLRVQLDQKFRTERPKLDPLLDADDDPDNPLAPALALFRERSRAQAPVVEQLHRLERDGSLLGTLAEIAPSLAHMHVNRFIRSSARAHEMVLYDFLYQTHRSRAARARKRAAADPAASSPAQAAAKPDGADLALDPAAPAPDPALAS